MNILRISPAHNVAAAGNHQFWQKSISKWRSFYQALAIRLERFFNGYMEKDFNFDEWLRGELELLYPCKTTFLESTDKLVICAEMPGCRAKDIKVCIEPARLTISGIVAQTLCDKFPCGYFCVLELPAIIDADNSIVKVYAGEVEIILTKLGKLSDRCHKFNA
jgi:HSP20 family molecular chaperone IbpA